MQGLQADTRQGKAAYSSFLNIVSGEWRANSDKIKSHKDTSFFMYLQLDESFITGKELGIWLLLGSFSGLIKQQQHKTNK